MSQASNQFMTIVSMTYTTLLMLQEAAVPADDRLKDLVAHGLVVAGRLIQNYPETGDRWKNKRIIDEWLDQWKDADSGIGYDAAGVWHPVILSNMGQIVIDDLATKVRNPAILPDLILLRELMNQISVVLMDTEPLEDEHRLLADSGALVSEIYEIVGYRE